MVARAIAVGARLVVRQTTGHHKILSQGFKRLEIKWNLLLEPTGLSVQLAMFAAVGMVKKARGPGKGPLTAPAASSFIGAMASSTGRATAVPNPFKKVRRGICQFFIRRSVL